MVIPVDIKNKSCAAYFNLAKSKWAVLCSIWKYAAPLNKEILVIMRYHQGFLCLCRLPLTFSDMFSWSTYNDSEINKTLDGVPHGHVGWPEWHNDCSAWPLKTSEWQIQVKVVSGYSLMHDAYPLRLLYCIIISELHSFLNSVNLNGSPVCYLVY